MKKYILKINLFFFIFWLLFFLPAFPVSSERIEIIWEKKLNGSNIDTSSEIICSDGDYYLIVGETNSKGAGNSDGWIIKIDQNGKVIWDKNYGGKANDGIYSIVEAEDNGYIVCGYTWSQDDQKDDGWIFKIDHNGKMIWEKTYGGKSFDRLTSVIKTPEKVYLATGFADRENCSLCSEQGYIWVINIAEKGEQVWERKFGGSVYDMANKVIQCQGGYILVGRVKCSLNDTISARLLKIDSEGSLLDNLMITRNKDNYFKSIISTEESGFFLVLGDSWFESSGSSDIWLLKLQL